MKIRSGFVSNSSSSSFVLLGYVLTKDDENTKFWILERFYGQDGINKIAQSSFQKNWNECDDDEKSDIYYSLEGASLSILGDTERGAPNEDVIVVGKVIEWFGNEGYEDQKNLDAMKYIDEVKEIGKKLGLEDMRIITGTAMT